MYRGRQYHQSLFHCSQSSIFSPFSITLAWVQVKTGQGTRATGSRVRRHHARVQRQQMSSRCLSRRSHGYKRPALRRWLLFWDITSMFRLAWSMDRTEFVSIRITNIRQMHWPHIAFAHLLGDLRSRYRRWQHQHRGIPSPVPENRMRNPMVPPLAAVAGLPSIGSETENVPPLAI